MRWASNEHAAIRQPEPHVGARTGCGCQSVKSVMYWLRCAPVHPGECPLSDNVRNDAPMTLCRISSFQARVHERHVVSDALIGEKTLSGHDRRVKDGLRRTKSSRMRLSYRDVLSGCQDVHRGAASGLGGRSLRLLTYACLHRRQLKSTLHHTSLSRVTHLGALVHMRAVLGFTRGI